MSSQAQTVRGRRPSSNTLHRANLRCPTLSMRMKSHAARSAETTIAVGDEERGTHGSHARRPRRVAAQLSRAHTPSVVEPLRGLPASSQFRGFAALTHGYCCFGRYAPGRRVMSPSLFRACHALCDAGGVMEISRWSSECSERTPPDPRHHSHAPRRVRQESPGSFRHPIRGALVMRCDPVVFARASLDHRLISVQPSGLRKMIGHPRRQGTTGHPLLRISMHLSV